MTVGRLMISDALEMEDAYDALDPDERIQLARDLAEDREARRFGWLDLGGEAGGA